MMHPNYAEGYFRPNEDSYAAFEVTPSIGHKRLFVLAIRGMRVDGSNEATAGAVAYSPDARGSEMAGLTAPAWQPLPSGARPQEPRAGDSYWARPVMGGVVSDAEGRLCEVMGRELRPLHRIVRGPQGQLLELLPVAPGAQIQKTRGEVIESELVDEMAQGTTESQEKMTAQRKAAPQQAARGSRVRCRKLFAEPGLPRVAELGKFRWAFAPQLTHPERLRDNHRLACHVQIYEALAPQRADEFFEAIQCAGHQNIPVQPLTEEAVAGLALTQFLTRRPRPAQDTSRDPGLVRPFEYFISLRVIADPTAEPASQPRPATPAASETRADLCAASSTKASPAAAPTTALRCEIPEHFQNPWEFRFSRDEALYDMSIARAARGSLSRVLRKAGGWFRSREEYRKWRALLCTKNLEDQLWTVRPPRGALADPTVREWARQALEAAGYDLRTMLLEWEVFWRRRGV